MTSNTNAGAALDFDWKGGLKNLNRELAAYDLLCEEEDERFPDEDGMTGVIGLTLRLCDMNNNR
jgi:hypothetical protein